MIKYVVVSRKEVNKMKATMEKKLMQQLINSVAALSIVICTKAGVTDHKDQHSVAKDCFEAIKKSLSKKGLPVDGLEYEY